MGFTTVLITGIGGVTPRAIAKSLKRFATHGPYRIIGVDCNSLGVGLYACEYVDQSYLVPRADHPDYWEAIETIIQRASVDVAVVQPEVEVEVWAAREEKPCLTLLPPYELASVLRDKGQTMSILSDWPYIPRSVLVNPSEDDLDSIGELLGYPYWVRPTKGSGGNGAMKITKPEDLRAWLSLGKDTSIFQASEFLPGRHLAFKALYYRGEFVSGAAIECVKYVMADASPTGVTGNTAFGRFINSPEVADIVMQCVSRICDSLGVRPEGVLSADLKEDKTGTPKITEINIRHMAYTSSLAQVGLNLSEDMVSLALGRLENVKWHGVYTFGAPYVFLRDVDIEPIVIREDELLK